MEKLLQTGFFTVENQENKEVIDILDLLAKEIISKYVFDCTDKKKIKLRFHVTRVIKTSDNVDITVDTEKTEEMDDDDVVMGLISSILITIPNELHFQDAMSQDFVNLYSDTIKILMFDHYIVMGTIESQTVLSIFIPSKGAFRYYLVTSQIKAEYNQKKPSQN